MLSFISLRHNSLWTAVQEGEERLLRMISVLTFAFCYLCCPVFANILMMKVSENT